MQSHLTYVWEVTMQRYSFVAGLHVWTNRRPFGFCVVQGIIELLKKGVYAGAQIKKRRYWPKFVKGGDQMMDDMTNDSYGTTKGV